MVFFDGDCAVCNTTVGFLLDHDSRGRLHYAPLQGQFAADVRSRHPEWPDDIDSIVFLEPNEQGEILSWHSGATVRIASYLPAPWSWTAACWVVPWPIRDAAYRAFAAVRYRIFGAAMSCRVPRPNEVDRFHG